MGPIGFQPCPHSMVTALHGRLLMCGVQACIHMRSTQFTAQLKRGSLVQSGCPEAWVKVWSRSCPQQPERYYRGPTSGPAAGAVVKTGTSPAVPVHASLPAAVVDVSPAAQQPARSVQSGCGGRHTNAGASEGRAANGSNSRRTRNSASGPVVDVVADAGPKLAARVSGRTQAAVTSTAAASQDLARGAQSGRAVQVLDTARSADPG
ncbi:hypothetical protein NDU88_006909 [Pleurodeles waltl]|uniref:Uncharacterized protein n=1 Tax=Pleurodeles waltl TaxID=8319 RepID=A0AAV7VSW7_PLEWA|nr:hypothetical protein NDU88_006909 [Pleurodeles waltl]